MRPENRLIVALDTSDVHEALSWTQVLAPLGVEFKIGLELIYTFMAISWNARDLDLKLATQAIDEIQGIFWTNCLMLDAKLADTTATVERAMQVIAKEILPDSVTVYASAGADKIKSAVMVCEEFGATEVLGVTVLTDMNNDDCKDVFHVDKNVQVIEFAEMLVEQGAHGIICAVDELSLLQYEYFSSLRKITPGIRPSWYETMEPENQVRIATPAEAIQKGADQIIVGRPITTHDSPRHAADLIIEEIRSVTG